MKYNIFLGQTLSFFLMNHFRIKKSCFEWHRNIFWQLDTWSATHIIVGLIHVQCYVDLGWFEHLPLLQSVNWSNGSERTQGARSHSEPEQTDVLCRTTSRQSP